MNQQPQGSLDWRYKGMRTLILENNFLRVVYLLDKGADVIEFKYKPLDVDLMWHSPQGYINPKEHVQPIATAESSFNDLYGGGWQDALPVIGNGPQEHRGAKYGTHGESALLPWDCVITEEREDHVSTVMRVRGVRYPFQLEKQVRIDRNEAKLHIKETLVNVAPQSLEFFWLQHPSFGEPFLGPDDKISLPNGTKVHNFEGINPNGRIAGGEFDWPLAKRRKTNEKIDLHVIPQRDLVAEETVFLKVKEGWYTLSNPNLGLSFKLEWDGAIFPWVWFWQNYNAPDYPYYGAAWNVAIEPASGLPNDIANQRQEKSLLNLDGGSSITTELTASIAKI